MSSPHRPASTRLTSSASPSTSSKAWSISLQWSRKAAIDIHDLRTLLDSLRMARRTAWQTIIRLITTGLLLALIAGIAVKLKIFG